jgi:DNA-binding MurR/RpiR family transcriptional regulator
MGVQTTIEASIESMSPSLARVATAIRDHPGLVLTSTINEIAERCDTSIASVVRFCQAIGLSGYAELRMALASELGKESAQFGGSNYGSDISATDSLTEVAAKISALEILAIEETVRQLDPAVLEQVVDVIDGADRILLFGVGASQLVAEDLRHKLFRIGRNVFAFSDPHEARSAAALAVGRTVAIAFSHLGETTETLEFLRIARESGVTTVGLTSVKNSSIAGLVDHVLFTEVRETAFRAGAMVSRVAQLVVVDCVFAGVAQRRYDHTVEALRRTREVTRSVRGA